MYLIHCVVRVTRNSSGYIVLKRARGSKHNVITSKVPRINKILQYTRYSTCGWYIVAKRVRYQRNIVVNMVSLHQKFGGIRNSGSTLDCWSSGQVIGGMIHNKIHLISPGCPQPSIALQCRIMAENTYHSINTSKVLSNKILQCTRYSSLYIVEYCNIVIVLL